MIRVSLKEIKIRRKRKDERCDYNFVLQCVLQLN